MSSSTSRQLVFKFLGAVDPSLNSALTKVQGGLKKSGTESDNTSKKLQTGLKIAAVAVAGAAVKLGKDAVDSFKSAASETIPLKRNLGLTAEDASRLRFELKMSGVDSATGAKGLTIFAKKVQAMASADDLAQAKAAASKAGIEARIVALKKAGSASAGYAEKMAELQNKLEVVKLTEKSSTSVLAQMGVKYRNAAGDVLPMSQLMPQLADKFSKMQDGPEKTALAMKLFGKSGTALLPFLNKGAAGLAELAKKSDLYGQTLTGDNLTALTKSKAAQRDWNAALEGLRIQFGAQLLPLITTGITLLTANMIPAVTSVTKFLKQNSGAVEVAVGVLAGLFGVVKTVIAVSKAWRVVQVALNIVMAANPIALVVIAIAALVAGVILAYQNCKEFRDVVNTAFKGIATAANWLWNQVFKPFVTWLLNGIATITGAYGTLLRALANVPGFGWAKGAADALKGVSTWAKSTADNLNGIPANKTTTVTARDQASAQLKTVKGNIADLKDKIVTAKAKGDDKGLQDLETKLAAAEKKKRRLQLTIKASVDDKSNTVVLKTTSKGTVKIGVLANGGILGALGQHVKRFADGGTEDHTAQIAPAGAMRLWAEPETGGESYIPLGWSKRGRSIPIWMETGRRLGVLPNAAGAVYAGTSTSSGTTDFALMLQVLQQILSWLQSGADVDRLLAGLVRAVPSTREVVRLG